MSALLRETHLNSDSFDLYNITLSIAAHYKDSHMGPTPVWEQLYINTASTISINYCTQKHLVCEYMKDSHLRYKNSINHWIVYKILKYPHSLVLRCLSINEWPKNTIYTLNTRQMLEALRGEPELLHYVKTFHCAVNRT